MAGFLCCALIWSGCAQYKRSSLLIKVPDYYPQRVQIHQLHLVADPYFEKSRVQHLFNSDILDRGILAVHFIAFNYGEEEYDLSRATFTLIKSDGSEIFPMEPKQVARKVLKHTSVRMIGWGFAGLVVLSIPFVIISGIDSRRSNQQTRDAVKDEAMRVFEIGSKEIVDGFYFFKLGRKSKEIERALQNKCQIKINGLVEQKSQVAYDFIIGLN